MTAPANVREHGTRAKYVVERCRCDDCRRAHRDYERWRCRQKAYGGTAYVDAEPVRAHLRVLSAQGLGWRRAARQSGIAESVVGKLLHGDSTRGQAPSKRVRRRTARALLAGRSRWLVAVQMVSEGVDIPRLAVGVYASTIATRLFFRQVVGRFVRTRGADDDLCASLFVPSIPILLAHAAEIEQERDHALSETIERAERERSEKRELTLELNVVEPIASSEATHHATILAGESFADAELRRALEFARQAGMPGNVQAAQVARLLRLAGAAGDPVRVTLPAPAASAALVDEKAALRKILARKVSQVARAADIPHKHVHGDLNKHVGDRVPTATVETLQKRLAVLDDWLSRLS